MMAQCGKDPDRRDETAKLKATTDKAIKLQLDRRARIFAEEAMAYYFERYGREATIEYLKDQISMLEQC